MTVLQRTDLTTSQKIHCAAAAVAGQHAHGSKTALSETYEISRPTVYAVGAKPYRSWFRASWFGKVRHRELLGNRVLVQKQPQGAADEPAQRAVLCAREHTEAPVVIGLETDGKAMLFHRSSPVLCRRHQDLIYPIAAV